MSFDMALSRANCDINVTTTTATKIMPTNYYRYLYPYLHYFSYMSVMLMARVNALVCAFESRKESERMS